MNIELHRAQQGVLRDGQLRGEFGPGSLVVRKQGFPRSAIGSTT